jgi:hypothetical protein
MLSSKERQSKILKGEVIGYVIPMTDRLVKNQRYWDRLKLSDDEFTLKWSPFHNPHLRMNDEQIELFNQDAKLFAEMYNANHHIYKGLMN